MNAYAQTLLDAAYSAYRNERFAEARAALGFAAGSGWRDLLTLRFMARVEERLGDLAAAVSCLSAAAEIQPADATVQSDLGNALRQFGQLDASTLAYQRAIELDASLTDPYGGLVHALHLLNRDTDALSWAEKALLQANDKADAHRMVGTALVWLNRHEPAIEHFRAAQEQSPGDAIARNHEGMALLAHGQFREGWRLHDARRLATDAGSAFRDHAQSMWHGDSDIDGRTILLHAEQGLGDAIQFVRYAPLVAARGAVVWLAAAAPLQSLFASVPGIARVIARHEPRPSWDFHCPLMSLPLAFGTDLASIPAEVPYLRADAERLETWRHRLGGKTRRRIGVAWSGNPHHYDASLRQLPLQHLMPLLQRQDCAFHVVQTGVSEADAVQLAELGVRVYTAELVDLAETAALMETLDLVISVDSAPAHLAGALGRPTWLLLPFSADWRWMRDRTDTPWYPTMRLFRQPHAGDWDRVVAEVTRALDALREP